MKFAFIAATFVVSVTATACSSSDTREHNTMHAHVAAPDLMIGYGCPTCHVISHVPGAVGKVGPSLQGFGQRSYLAGTLQNSPENLILWLQHPQRIHPGSAMPEMGVTPTDAARIAAFLQSN